MEKVAIVIVNWNTGELLAKCVRSLAALPTDEIELIDEVIVVDNASSDESVVKAEVMAGQHLNTPRVRFVREQHNLGFARANNVGLARVRERHGADLPHVLLLNPDTEVRAGALQAMVAVLAERTKTGVVGPQLLNSDGTVQESLRRFPTLKTFVLLMLKLGRLVDFGTFDYGKEQVVDQVMGAAFLIRNQTLAAVGDLDEVFWVWFEEVDYCQRVAAADQEVVYTPNAQVVHWGGASFAQLVGFKKALPWLASSLHYAKKYLRPGEVWWLRSLIPVSLLIMIPAAVWHMLQRSNNQKKLRHDGAR